MPDRIPEIDLTGPDGNAYALMAHANDFAKQFSWDQDQIDAMINDMKSGDYDHLVEVFDKHFGEYCTLYR